MKLQQKNRPGLTRSEVKQRLDAVPSWCASIELCAPEALYASGGDKPLSREQRHELIRALRAGDVVELELDAVTYIQREGPNRNFVRFKPGILASFAKSYAGVPFLRDHAQDQQGERGGTVISAKLEHNEDGSKQIRMRLRLVKPWAVESALDGTLDRFSIGWHRDRTLPLVCSACNADWLKCDHWPGELADGKPIELVIMGADGTECSSVNVPAVVGTSIDSISQLSTIDPAWVADMLAADTTHGEDDDMKILAALISALALPANATEDDVLKAVEKQRDDLSSAGDQLTIAREQLATTRASLSALQADEKQRGIATRLSTVAAGIATLVAAGKLKPGSAVEGALRRQGGVTPKLGADGKQLLEAGKPVFEVDMSKSIDVFTATVDDMLTSGPVVTPVGASLPGNTPDPAPAVVTGGKGYLAAKPETAKWLAKAGIAEADFEKHGETGREIAGMVFGG